MTASVQAQCGRRGGPEADLRLRRGGQPDHLDAERPARLDVRVGRGGTAQEAGGAGDGGLDDHHQAFGYDAAGNRTRFTDGRGNDTWYQYGTFGLESVIEPSTLAHPALTDRRWQTRYDPTGLPVQPDRARRGDPPAGVRRRGTSDQRDRCGRGGDHLIADADLRPARPAHVGLDADRHRHLLLRPARPAAGGHRTLGRGELRLRP
ncbi:hypothetical protein [Nocardioides convexus]|uniref:hypothetical protein n=1 Tax=Nocardioides convexus TaxID=2712224 RepID=UPI002418B3CD|nr:hypothetical protein [Nocardioides convexus]